MAVLMVSTASYIHYKDVSTAGSRYSVEERPRNNEIVVMIF